MKLETVIEKINKTKSMFFGKAEKILNLWEGLRWEKKERSHKYIPIWNKKSYITTDKSETDKIIKNAKTTSG